MSGISISRSDEKDPIFVLNESVCPIDEGVAKAALIGTAVVLLAISGLAASGLLLPHTSFGLILTQVIGETGLIAASSASGIVVLALTLTTIYLQFRAQLFSFREIKHSPEVERESGSEEIETSRNLLRKSQSLERIDISEKDNRGFLYKIKDEDGETCGYLYGTMHNPDLFDFFSNKEPWPGLNNRIRKKIDSSKTVYAEDLLDLPLSGPDMVVIEYAKNGKKQLRALDSNHMSIVEKEKNFAKKHADYEIKYSDRQVVRQGISMTDIWLKGDVKKVSRLEFQVYKDETIEKEYYKFLMEDRNQNWIRKVLPKLRKASIAGKIFIACGYGHLFYRSGDTGLITLLEEKGFQIESAYPDLVEASSSED